MNKEAKKKLEELNDILRQGLDEGYESALVVAIVQQCVLMTTLDEQRHEMACAMNEKLARIVENTEKMAESLTWLRENTWQKDRGILRPPPYRA